MSMNINYKDYPIIGYLKSKKNYWVYWWNEDERNKKIVEAVTNLNDNRDKVKSVIGSNIYVLSKRFFETMMASSKSFEDYSFDLCSYGIEPQFGCFVVESMNTVTKKMGKVAFLYNINHKSLQVWQMENTDTMSIYVMISFEKDEVRCAVSELIMQHAAGSPKYIVAGSALMMVRLYLLFRQFFHKVDAEKLYPRQGKRNAAGAVEMKNDTDTVVNVLTTRWYTEIHHDGDFPVRPHFRMQPKKNANGEWTRELIAIEGFTKHGYHRKAQNDIATHTA